MNATVAKPNRSMDEIMIEVDREAKEAEAWGTKEGYGIKGLKVAKYLSEETTAFAASITKNGKVVGDAKNDGHGGSTFVHVNGIKENGLNPGDYGMLETWVDILVERAEEEKWLASQTKSMAKKGVDLILFVRTGRSAVSVVGDYGDKAVAVAKATKQYGVAPFKVVDLSTTSAKVREEAKAISDAKWRDKVKSQMKAAGAKAVVFYKNEKGGTSAKGFRKPNEATVFAKTAKGGEVVLL